MPLGLQAYWEELLEVLSSIADVYEKANMAMSLLTLKKMRTFAALLLGKRKKILDAGAGPGAMIPYVLSEGRSLSYYVALDPLIAMLRKIDVSDGRLDKVRGVFEYLPFRQNCFDACLTSFSFRDAYDYPRALLMIFNVLKVNGVYVLLDLLKGRNGLGEAMRWVYFNVVPRAIGMLLMGPIGYKLYSGLGKTYEKYISSDEILILSRRVGFRKILVRPMFKMSLLMVALK